MMDEIGATGIKSMRRGKHWPRWIQAERKVQRILAELPMEHFIVANDIKFRYGNIDHLVLRDDGTIFVIETKSRRGRITWDGKQILFDGQPSARNHLCQMNRTIRWLRDFTRGTWRVNPWFVAILVFPEGFVPSRRPVKRVHLMDATRILELLTGYPRQG